MKQELRELMTTAMKLDVRANQLLSRARQMVYNNPTLLLPGNSNSPQQSRRPRPRRRPKHRPRSRLVSMRSPGRTNGVQRRSQRRWRRQRQVPRRQRSDLDWGHICEAAPACLILGSRVVLTRAFGTIDLTVKGLCALVDRPSR